MGILYFFKSVFLRFFEKKQVFVLFLEKNKKPYSELFLLHHAISPFENHTLMTCYTYYGIQIRG